METEDKYVSPDKKQVISILNLIDEHFREQHYCSFYLKKIGMTEYRANRLLRHYNGMSLYELIHYRMHQESLALLTYSFMSVKEITYELGLDDPSNFTKAFIRKEGLSPSRYREENRCFR